MDINARFDQLESLMVDFGRKQDQLIVEVRQHGEALGRIEQRLDTIDEKIGAIDEQIGAIIQIFKISEARHTQTEQRQDTMLVEIREQGRELKEQGRRMDEAMQIQIQMLQLLRAGNDKTEGLAQRLAPLEAQEPRLKRLEDEVFRAAS